MHVACGVDGSMNSKLKANEMRLALGKICMSEKRGCAFTWVGKGSWKERDSCFEFGLFVGSLFCLLVSNFSLALTMAVHVTLTCVVYLF